MDVGGAVGSVAEASAISLPKGGGAVSGLGESFAADQQTGAGTLTLPLSLPPGRPGLTPSLALTYSTGSGNGDFGLGWSVLAPGVSRKTTRGVPRYDSTDTFVFADGEDLVRRSGTKEYRKRTEGQFARIEHLSDAGGDRWEIRERSGVLTRYATVLAGPGGQVFAWMATQTADPLGNLIRYSYTTDHGRPVIERIEYADYGDRADPRFLVAVEFGYEQRPDPFSDRRPGFEVRTTLRCKVIRVCTRASDGVERVVREYRLGYRQAPFSGVSLLEQVEVVGIDGDTEEPMPPLTLGYTAFEPQRCRFARLRGLPVLNDPDLALIDLRGNGLPDVVEMAGAHRFWANKGGGRFAPARVMAQAPPHALSEGGVRLIDADGDGHTDLLTRDGYYSLRGKTFTAYKHVPGVDLADPAVRLIDLDGDGLTDVLRSGTRLECWFNHPDPEKAWQRTAFVEGPAIDLTDPRVRLADMTGDGLQDIVFLRDGNISYRPGLGHGRWGALVQMRHAPRLPRDHDPRRLLLGDVDGDGAADLIYLDYGRVLLWGNLSGDAWSEEPIVITGTPDVTDRDDVQLADVNGTGMGGLLYSRSTDGSARFLDFCGGVKPLLLSTVDNQLGARISISYRPSTSYFLRGQWRTALPFPVQVVAAVAVDDAISGGRLVTEYRYHHGYWDGVEREFRGFARVDRLDTETLPDGGEHYSPPTLTKTWIHMGTSLDLRDEYWPGQEALEVPVGHRALRGSVLRTELYALDGSEREDRPYTVTDSSYGVRPEAPGVDFPFLTAIRTTQWERGSEPMSRYTFESGHDAYGFVTRRLAVAVPRRPGDPYLSTYDTVEFARNGYLVDRVCRARSFEVLNDGSATVTALRDSVFSGTTALRPLADVRTYFDGPAFLGLPLGQLGEHGLKVREESLVLTDDFAPNLNFTGFPTEFVELTPPLAGYAYRDGGYYTKGARYRYDVHDPSRTPRGLALETLDPLGAPSLLHYDEHELSPVRAVDALGLETLATHDLRLLKVATVTDPNGNTSRAVFTPLGLVTATFLQGKHGEGDLAEPSSRIEYDVFAFARRAEPVSARSIQRTHHDTEAEIPQPQRDRAIVTVEYCDGFGRVVQTRSQAEEPGAVVVSGHRIYDNKGRVVESYEPFFSTGWDYTSPELGPRTVTRYDPLGRQVRTVLPDGSETLALHGIPIALGDPRRFEPTPWETYTYDANDNAGRTGGADADPSHFDTPNSTEVDALGRTIAATARTGDRVFVTRSTYDIRGNLVAITDPLGREAFRCRVDLAGRRWRVDGADAGWRETVHDGLGRAIVERDAKGSLTLGAFDRAARPIRVWARNRASERVTLRQVLEYGDGGTPDQPPGQRAAARAKNLLGQAIRHYDEAGLVVVTDIDFKGNVLESARQVVADAAVLGTYGSAPGWEVPAFRVDWDVADRGSLLESSAYLTGTRYDALNRVNQQILPAGADSTRRRLTPEYHLSGGLSRLLLDGVLYVERIAYDARGRRTEIGYGNGVVTRYHYDPLTFRLTGLRSTRGGEVIQDYAYTYDPAGNMVSLRDRSTEPLERTFAYDATYRLVRATGRETDLPPDSPPWTVDPRPVDVTQARPYSESYTYDAAGALLRLVHSAAVGFTREFTVDPASNRLRRMVIGNTPFDYEQDANGNLVGETTTRRFAWDHGDRLVTFATQTPGAEPSVHAHYLHGSSGERVKKLVRRQGGAVEVTHYLGGFEHHRWGTGPSEQNNHVHVMDDERRIALVRVGPAAPGDRGPAVAFHLSDHLGSATVTIDGAGVVTNREEYTPYGETCFGSYTLKRYRFTGRERDEESGLSRHGARYCLVWLGRWASCDPAGASGGINQYAYAACDPVNHNDAAGLEPKKKPDAKPDKPKPKPKPAKPTMNDPYTRGEPPGRVTSGIGNQAQYNQQVPAVRDAQGVRMSEHEHGIPGSHIRETTTNPLTGVSDYDRKQGYAHDTTTTTELDTAHAKTHSGPDADNRRLARIKDAINDGRPVSYNTELMEASLAQWDRAAAATNSSTTPESRRSSILKQSGDHFSLLSLQEAGEIASQFPRCEAAPAAAAYKEIQYNTWEKLAAKPVVEPKLSMGAKRIAVGGAVGLLVTFGFMGMSSAATGEPPTAEEVGVGVVGVAVPQATIVTAKQHGEEVIPIMCIPLWKVCAVVGGLAILGAANAKYSPKPGEENPYAMGPGFPF